MNVYAGKEAVEKDLADAAERAARTKLVVLDVHGVLTSGAILYNEDGVKFQTFCHDDGFGANCLMMLGVEVALMTRKSKIVEIRAQEVGIKHVFQAKDKTTKLQEVAAEMGISLDDICFVGDEIIDIGVMKSVGFAVAPANAASEAKAVAHFVTQRAGGQGVLRELGEFILRAQGKWDGLVAKVSSKGWG
jgi:3-deoxy-D-manno-octulosonate 8-phosphate phosphatase (KDO 8-P phosphatase)